MKTLTIELPDDVYADLEFLADDSSEAGIGSRIVEALREQLGLFDSETALAKLLSEPCREWTDELTEEWDAEIDRRIDRRRNRLPGPATHRVRLELPDDIAAALDRDVRLEGSGGPAKSLCQKLEINFI